MIHHVKKIWGSEDWLINNEKYCAKFLNLNQGYECSVHYHMKKDETFYVLAGEVELYLFNLREICCANLPIPRHDWFINNKIQILQNMKSIILKAGDQYRLSPFTAHKFRAVTFCAKILEVSTTHYEDDSYRLTESQKL